MNKKSRVLLFALFVVLAAVMMAYFMYTRQDARRFVWVENYRASSDQPYGTRFIQQLLASYKDENTYIFNESEPLHKILDTALVKRKTDYVFIGNEIHLEETDRDALLNFIERGNDAFIASINLPFDLLDGAYTSECNSTMFLQSDDTVSVTLNFYNENIRHRNGYQYAYRFGKADLPYYWSNINPEVFCDSTKQLAPLGYIQPDRVNFIRISHGQGNLYLHTNPLVFTNYFLSKHEQAEYASSVFSHMKGETIIWDEFSKRQLTPQNNAPQMSPMSYILQQDSLRYAWWLTIFAAVLYVLFTAKRKQRVIPVLAEKNNTSLEFINMISSLHFQNGNNQDIARKKMKYFYYFIRAKYAIHTQALTAATIKRLSEKSKVDISYIELIAHEFYYLENQPYYHAPKLVDLYNALNKFYKTCK